VNGEGVAAGALQGHVPQSIATVRHDHRRRGLVRIGRLRGQDRVTGRDFAALGDQDTDGRQRAEAGAVAAPGGHHESGEPDGCQIRRRGCRHARHRFRGDDLMDHRQRAAAQAHFQCLHARHPDQVDRLV